MTNRRRIDIPAPPARHVRPEVAGTCVASTHTSRCHRLRIDETWIGAA
ncbi:hypothetical protein ACFVYE_07675 [Streptomyces sp. NPDC058239]